LQSRKRAATDDHKEFVNVDMTDRLGRISMENDDETQPKPPVQMQTHPYNSYVVRCECVSFVD